MTATKTASKTKQAALEKLNQQIEQDSSLPLRSSATHTVPGEGNPDADIMFIGEGPGQKEDELGRPFVGAAGKFLDELIEAIGYKREDVFIANIIKHRPPGNRDPLPDEIAAYTPWLEKQIEIIQPKLIVTLGRYSTEYFLGPGFSISKIHAQPKRKNNRIIMPMYHPAAALYQGSLRATLLADFKKIPKVLDLINKNQLASEEKEEEQKPIEQQKSLL